MDIVLVPTYLRAEFLWLCLDRIHKADRPPDLQVWILEDMRKDDEHRHGLQFQWTKEVLSDYCDKLVIKHHLAPKHQFPGNSFNTIHGYKMAYNTDARYVYLIEDDVLVMPDFFKWHEAVHKTGDYFCSVAYRCSRNGEAHTFVDDPDAYFTSHRDYASIGVCWPRENLRPLMPHACDEYYENMQLYCLRHFPNYKYGGDFSEQDGLLMRLLDAQEKSIAWPYLPRAYHAGFFGYHRPNGRRPDGPLAQKITELGVILSDSQRLLAASPDFGDIEPIPFLTPNQLFGTLYKVQEFQ